LISLTGVCFLFGGVMAMQLRAVQGVRAAKVKDANVRIVQEKQAAIYRAQAEKAEKENAKIKREIELVRDKLNKSGNLTKKQLAALNSQLGQLQLASGLTQCAAAASALLSTITPQQPKLAATRAVFLPASCTTSTCYK
jgi:hypothetical protein